jgi:hypothetical protein
MNSASARSPSASTHSSTAVYSKVTLVPASTAAVTAGTRVGEAAAYTGKVPAEAARRLLAGEGRPGAYTPAAVFGPELAQACGGEYLTATAGR